MVTDQFIVELDSIFLELRSRHLCEINMCGDFNIDLHKPRDLNTKKYRDFIRRTGFTNVINDVTHIRNAGIGFSCIDHFNTTNADLFFNSGSIASNASDHFFIYATRKKMKVDHRKTQQVGRAFSKVNQEKSRNDIESHNWETIYSTDDSEMCWSMFKRDFTDILYNHAPLRLYYARDDRQPWVSREFLDSCNERDDRQRKAKRTNSPIDKLLANQARNRTVSLKRDLKRLFFQTSIQNHWGTLVNYGKL